MKLYLNKTSPYARLVSVTAHEAGFADRIETVWVEPWDDDPALLAVNPLGKVPALVTDSGIALIESALICQHLVMKSGRRHLMPANPALIEGVLYRLGIGRAIIDDAFGIAIQRRFADGETPPLARRWLKAVPRAVAALEAEAATRPIPAEPDLADVTVAVALDYVDFRLPEIGWRAAAPALAQAVDTVKRRPAMVASDPR